MNGGTVSIASTTLDTNSQFGIYATGNTGTVLTVADNLFTNNSVGAAYILPTNGLKMVNNSGNRAVSGGKRGFIFFGDISTSQTWAGDGMPYIVASGGFTIPSTKVLTIDPGAVVKFESEFASIVVSGTLDAEGLDGENIYFTSIADDNILGDTNNGGASDGSPGDWSEIKFNSGSIGNVIYANILYGGYAPGGGDANINNNGGKLIIASSTIASSTTYGIYQASGSATTTSAFIIGHTYGIFINGGTATTSFSSLINNTSYGMYNGSGTSINAENNYWGAADGPSGVGPGTGNAVSSNIDYDPWDSEVHYILDYSSVNSMTNEIRYISTTAYTDAWYGAVATWNAMGAINIATDTASTTADLGVSDVYDSSVNWVGLYCPNPTCDGLGVGQIWFNSYYLDGLFYTSNKKLNTAIHELGHALGLQHHSLVGNIMYRTVTSLINLGNQDESDYNYLYP